MIVKGFILPENFICGNVHLINSSNISEGKSSGFQTKKGGSKIQVGEEESYIFASQVNKIA